MNEPTLSEAAEPHVVGDCIDCGGQMIETTRSLNQDADRGHLGLTCQDCGETGRIVYVIGKENPWQNPSELTGVTDTTVEPVAWIDCPRCDGYGWVEDPLCDLTAAMNGRDTPCSRCHTSGSVPTVVGGDRE